MVSSVVCSERDGESLLGKFFRIAPSRMTSEVFIESKQDIEVLKNVPHESTSKSLLARLLVGQSGVVSSCKS